MGMMDKFLGAMRLNVPYDEDMDEEEEFQDDMDDMEEEAPRKRSLFGKKDAEDDYEEDAAPVTRERPAKKPSRSSRVVSMSEHKSSGKYEVCMIVSRSAEDLDQIADLLISGKAVVLNLEGINTNEAQRIIDFTCGACYTMGGRLQRISNKIFIATPNYIDLSGDFIDMLNDSMDMSALNLSL